jgi:SAM-dependent methyltransferase
MIEPLPIDGIVSQPKLSNPHLNRVALDDAAFHNWYRFVLSFPPHLVRDYLRDRFRVAPGQVVLDPFCGTGTTVVEAKRLGYVGIGIEAHPMSHFASTWKTTWTGDPDELTALAARTSDAARRSYAALGSNYKELEKEESKLLLTGSISPRPLHRVLILREQIERFFKGDAREYARLALAKIAVSEASNLHFGPEVGVRGRKKDAKVFEGWELQMRAMAADLRSVEDHALIPQSVVHFGDARNMEGLLEPRSIHAVFTSPPYPNEKDYTRTTRLESVILGFLNDRASLRKIKQPLMRSNTRNVYKGDEDHLHIERFPEIIELADEIERKRIELEKDSGFEKLYARVTRLYFGGMARHFEQLRAALAPGALLGYVVGDQASFFRIHIPTAEILARIAQHYGYEHVGTDVFRTRIATATRRQMEEHVLLLQWPG